MTVRRYAAAVAAIEQALRPFSDVRPLLARELSAYRLKLTAGWEIPGLIANSEFSLRVLVPATTPYSPPRIAVAPAPPPLSWPHLEEHGLLCLLQEGATHQLDTTGSLAIELLAEGKSLVEAGLAGNNTSDFEDEFLSYWARWPKRTAVMYSACRPAGPSRWVSAWHATSGIYVGDDQGKLRAWLDNRFGESLPKHIDIEPIPLLWLPKPPIPAAYPPSVAALFSLLSDDSVELLREHLLDRHTNHHSAALGCDTRSGKALFGIRVASPARNSRGGRELLDGFRKANVPSNVLLTRYLGTPLVGADVIRVDASWIHGRDSNLELQVLLSKSAVIIGAGAVGSSIATLLAKAGVGTLVIVDPQRLGPENASRHELGIGEIGANKAEALANELRKRLPNLAIRGLKASCVEFCEQHGADVREADLVISATADWAAETWLNAWALENRRGRATMFGWMEPYAAAGHAVATWGQAPCLRCLLDESGKLPISATTWPERTTRPIPACGGEFQPYGVVELTHVHALIADLALDVLQCRVSGPAHRAWLGRTDHLKRIDGGWNPAWTTNYGDPGAGGAIRELPYRQNSHCPECAAA